LKEGNMEEELYSTRMEIDTMASGSLENSKEKVE